MKLNLNKLLICYSNFLTKNEVKKMPLKDENKVNAIRFVIEARLKSIRLIK